MRTTGQAMRLRVKRCIDLVLGGAALVVVSPILALVAAAVRLDSAGPAFFRQTRIGRDGRPFRMWKFRTMIRDAPDDLHRNLVLPLVESCARPESEDDQASIGLTNKLAGDPRITRVGGWLRRSSLDELPQLINVVCGEMSLVGPRPPLTYEYEAYAAWQLERFEMPQGMTGLWQVCGRHRVSYRRMHELDVEYVRRWSLRLDFRILAKTLRAIVVDREPA